MSIAAKFTLGLIVCFVAAAPMRTLAQGPADPVQDAADEAVRRQEATIRMRLKLTDAQAAQRKGELAEAAKLYQEAYALFPFVTSGNAVVDAEKTQVVTGLVGVRLQLAQAAHKRDDLAAANEQVSMALKIDPKNETARHMQAEIDKEVAERQGTTPSPAVLAMAPAIQKEKIQTATEVQNAKFLYEMGKYDEAEATLKNVLKQDPGNKAAFYYLDLIKEARFMDKGRAREEKMKENLIKVESSWIPSDKGKALPQPNPMARTNLIYTSRGRQEISSKLERIRLREVSYDSLPLSEVLKQLRDESRKILEPLGESGINFLINPHSDATLAPAAATPDAAGGAAAAPAVVATPAAPVDLNGVIIKISPPLNDMRLADVLDAITKVADVPIKYSIEDYAVVFSPRPPEAVALYSKTFKVDPNTFVQGLENVISLSLGDIGSSGGGGGGGGGGRGGGGNQGGQNGDNQLSIDIPRVSLAGGSGGGGRGGNRGGGTGQGQSAGLNFVTRTNNTATQHELVKQYFIAAGVDLNQPGKSIMFNDRLGMLYVRASMQDLDIIEQAIETLNLAPPQLTIEAKFAEVTQDDSRALGFDWFLGNTLINGGRIGAAGGTQPSMGSPDINGTTANPSGVFPGPLIPNGAGQWLAAPGTVGASASDNLLTSGLRQTVGKSDSMPAVATITGILTDPQFRVVIRALEQRKGADLLSAPKVTTLSGRQAHVSVLDLVQVVTGVDLNQTGSGGGNNINGNAGAGVVATTIQFDTISLPFGPVLDVLPTVSADGYSIQMVLIPTITEFLQYDPPGQFVPQAQSVGGTTVGIPLTAVLPLPHFRMRQVVTTCNVWDGQTVVLGGLISEDIIKIKDKVPVLGDLPFLGRLFRSESSQSSKKNLMIFVTPTIIDPAGNRLHSEEEMPFAKTSIPPQAPLPPQ